MKALVAVDKNLGIGYKGELLERIPEDIKFFKQSTLGKVVIMGRATFLSLPRQEPLKDRINIVLCEDKQFSDKEITVCSSLNEIFSEIKKYPADEVFVIGGEVVFAELLPYCSEAYVTKIENTYPADRYFPNLDNDERWKLIYCGESRIYNNISYCFTTYVNEQVQKY
jgi:dihydrofolate reductase